MSGIGPTSHRSVLGRVALASQVLAAMGAVRALLTARHTQPPVAVAASRPSANDHERTGSFAIVIPARDEAERLPPLLAALTPLIAHGVDVIVVDDESTDATARVAVDAGARVVSAEQRPPGWLGKPWALHNGLLAVDSSIDWVVCLDADTRPDARLPDALVARAEYDQLDFVTVGGRFDCPTAGARWLHPSLLATLVYRFGAPGQIPRPRPSRQLANGQCMVFRRQAMVAADGFSVVAGEVVEDVALARLLAERGWSVEFLDAADLFTVRMFDDAMSTWRGWARSIALPGVEPTARQIGQLAMLTATMVVPPIGLVTSRTRWGRLVNGVCVALRWGTLAGTTRSYGRRGVAYWLSPLADPLAVAAFALNVVAPRQSWRGRTTNV